MFCIHCGAELPDGVKFCPQCGKPTAGAAPQAPAPDFTTDTTGPLRPQYDDLEAPSPAPGGPSRPPQKARWTRAALAAAVLLVVAAIVAALMLFRPWMMPSGLEGVQSAISSVSPELSASPDEGDGVLPDGEIEWDDYDGNWSAGGYRFSLLTERRLLTVTLAAEDRASEQVTCDLDVFSSDDPLPFGDLTLRLIPRAGGALRVSINGHVYDAIRSNNRPPETPAGEDEAPTLNASDSGYLFYSPATGTHSTGGVIPADRPDLHFWPLDQFAISAADLDRLTREEIDIIRNETFARHGYVFTSEEWDAFFARYDWYEPDPSFTEDGFSQLEKQNIDTIVLYEQEKGWL